VEGDPPLTANLVDQDREAMEFVLGIRLTEPQSAEHRQRVVEEWKKSSKADREAFLTRLKGYADLRRLTGMTGHYAQVLNRANVQLWHCKHADDSFSASLLASYQSAHPTTPVPASAVPVASAGKRLREGSAPFTPEMLRQLGDFLEWVVEAPLIPGAREGLEQIYVQAAREKDKLTLEDAIAVSRCWTAVAALDPAARDMLRIVYQPEFLANLDNGLDDDLAQYQRGFYQATHRPLAAGDPPLTRQVADAHAELLCFQINAVAGSPVAEATPEVREHVAADLAAAYPKESAGHRSHLAQAPLTLATLRVLWPELPQEERRELCRRWKQELRPLLEQKKPA
jgi:hypothetical protein